VYGFVILQRFALDWAATGRSFGAAESEAELIKPRLWYAAQVRTSIPRACAQGHHLVPQQREKPPRNGVVLHPRHGASATSVPSTAVTPNEGT
jgi:hypothetical protein